MGCLLLAAACSSDSKTTSTSSGSTSSSSAAVKAAACDTAPGAPAAAGSTVEIAFVGALTGSDASLGINIRNGAKTAIDAYNKAGPKYKVELKEFDTAGDPAQANTVKDQFVSDPKVVGVIGPAFSGETKAVLPSFDENCLPMISASATNTLLPKVVEGSKVFHRAIADDSFQGKGIGDYIVKTLAGKAIVVIDDNSEYGKGLADDTTKAIEADGAKVAKRLSIPDPKAQDFSAQVNDAKTQNPDVVMYGGYYESAGRLRKQLTDAGVSSQFISGDGSLDPGFVTAAGAAGDGALLSCPCNLANDASTGELLSFYDAYKADNNVEPGTYSPEAFDVANIYLKAIDTGATDRAGILKAINGLGLYKGISKDIEFETNGNIKTPSLFVFQVKAGKIIANK
ncbi:MAG: branched-chain amino acid ABC transporter substrate-binding protein [Acidimicrobiales bacterium]